MTRENLLMVADSERDANMRYAAGFSVEEPIVFMRLGGKSYLVLNDPEIGRAHSTPRTVASFGAARTFGSCSSLGASEPTRLASSAQFSENGESRRSLSRGISLWGWPERYADWISK